MKYTVWGLLILLLIVRQDYWFWSNSYLVFGFMPIGLAYHAGISMAAAFTWYLATLYAWPLDEHNGDATASTTQSEQNGGAA